MMNDFELAMWSLSAEEKNMLMIYILHYDEIAEQEQKSVSKEENRAKVKKE